MQVYEGGIDTVLMTMPYFRTNVLLYAWQMSLGQDIFNKKKAEFS